MFVGDGIIAVNMKQPIVACKGLNSGASPGVAVNSSDNALTPQCFGSERRDVA
jgi:hypothetical protein